MEMTTWDYNQEKERAAADVSNKKHADLRDMVFDERHACHLLNQEFGKVKAELAALKAAHAWIKTSERMPEETCDVLGVVDGVVTLLNYDEYEDDSWADWSDGNMRGYSNDDVSHWTPLPEAPK
jgi:hypothetical protein